MEVITNLMIFGILYLIYQLIRNRFIYKIRIKWIETNDNRYNLYSYDFMINPNTHNYFGLRFPKECNYVKK